MKYLLLFFFIPTLLFAQTSKKTVRSSGYVIEGNISGAANMKIYLIENAPYTTVHKKDSTEADGKGIFSFAGHVKQAVPYVIRINDMSVDFINDNARLQIQGDLVSLYKAHITGSIEQEVANKYVAHMEEMENEYQKIEGPYAGKNIDSATKAMVIAKDDSIRSRDEPWQKNFIKKYAQTYFGIQLISGYINAPGSWRKADSMLSVCESNPAIQPELVASLRQKLEGVKTMRVGKEAPEFQERDTSGKLISSSFKGSNYTVLDFWASWCHPCRDENPSLVKIYERHKSKNLRFISISLDSKRSEWVRAIKHDRLSWIQLSDLKGWRSSQAQQYYVMGIPEFILIDPNGIVVAMGMTVPQLDQKLEEVLN